MAESVGSSRFAAVSVDEFIENQENENTKRKTQQNVALLEEFLLTCKQETRKIEVIPPSQLNEYLSEFVIVVRKKDSNEEYEPNSLRSMFASFERHLKKQNYGYCLFKDKEFERARKALQSKQKDLKQKGKGNKPNASVALSEDEVNVLYEKELLGVSSAEALLNTVWFNNTIHFGLRGCKEHRDMCWGDVKLRQTATGLEYLEYFERQTKTRTGDNPRDVRKVTPKMFAVPSSTRDPVAAYKAYAEKRPVEMNCDDAPFYLAKNICKSQTSTKPWFKNSAIGVNTLNSLMKTMAEKAGLGPNIKNHSGRKTMMQTLSNNEIPPTDIIQLSGHKNLQSVTNYSTVSQNQQKKMSQALSCLSTQEIVSQNKRFIEENAEFKQSQHSREDLQQGSQQVFSLLSGANIQGGTINIAINTVSKSPVAETHVESSKRYKRIRVLDSDSDE